MSRTRNLHCGSERFETYTNWLTETKTKTHRRHSTHALGREKCPRRRAAIADCVSARPVSDATAFREAGANRLVTP